MRADEGYRVADGGADRVREIFSENDEVGSTEADGDAVSARRFESVYSLGRCVGQDLADIAFIRGDDAFNKCVAFAGATRDYDLLVEVGGRGDNVGKLGEACEQRLPVADAVVFYAHELDVGTGVDEAVLQVAAHAVGDGEGDDERGNSGGNSGDGDSGDYTDDGLSPFGFEISGRHEEFKSHLAGFLLS